MLRVAARPRTRDGRIAFGKGGWGIAFGGRMGYAYAPRFVLSCTEELLVEEVSIDGLCGVY